MRLGRGLEYYDAPAVRAIMREARPSDYRFSSLILGIVNSAAISDEGARIMIITKMALPRRTFLRGLGVRWRLPLLDAMVPALSAVPDAGTPVRRLGFVYAPTGWPSPRPSTTGGRTVRALARAVADSEAAGAVSRSDGGGQRPQPQAGRSAWATATAITRAARRPG